MGRGDKKTAKGKRTMGSYGNSRKRKSTAAVVKPSVKKVAKKDEATVEKKTVAKKAATPKAKVEKKPAVKKVAAKKTEE